MGKSTEKGSVLISVLILVVIVVLIMGAVASFITGGIQRTKATSSKLQALYLAEAGAEKAIEQLKGDWDNTDEVDWTDFPSSPPSDKVGKYKFTINPQYEGATKRVIEARGKASGIAGKEVEEKIAVVLRPFFDLALFVGDKIDMGSSGSSQIVGNVATNADKKDSVIFPWSAKINGDLYIGPEADLSKEPGNVIKIRESQSLKNNVTGEVGKLSKEREYPPPQFPDYPTGLPNRENIKLEGTATKTISADGSYESIEVNSDTKLYINTGGENEERVILVDDFKLNQGHIILQGSGKLKLYVKNIFAMGGDSTINYYNTGSDGKIDYGTGGKGDPTRATLYYGGKGTLTFGGNVGFNGTVVVKDADVNIDNSGKFTGNLISGGTKVTVKGDGSAVVKVIYAPNATVKLDNSGKVRGAVVCQNFEASGDARLIYDKSVQNIELPADVLPSLGGSESGGESIFITSWESGLS